MLRSTTIAEPLALWCRGLGLFAVALVVVDIVLHRFGQLTTPVALAIGGTGFAVSGLALLVGLYVGVSIWIRGRAGAARAAVGMIAAGGLWLWPLAYLPSYLSLPRINDVSTDTANPPRFAMLGQVRGPGANAAAYAGERVARLQTSGYPDLRTFVVDRSADEVFDLAVNIVRGRRGLGWRVLAEEAPSTRPLKPGLIEATERTLLVGFVDDIAIRVSGTETEARVDVRSASRFGRFDFGANASRIRRFLRELQTRLESTQPGMAARGTRAARAQAGVPAAHGKANVKQPLSRSSATKGQKGERDPVPRDARRGPAPKAQPRG